MDEKIKLFAMSNQMAERSLDYVEKELRLDLRNWGQMKV